MITVLHAIVPFALAGFSAFLGWHFGRITSTAAVARSRSGTP